jgi:nucleoside-diphosphate-sugar epimerase
MIFASAYLYDGETEDSVHENSPKNPMNPYAHTKYLGEQLCEFFYKHYGVAVVIVRPFNVYGGAQSNHFLIPSIIEQVVSDCEFITVKDLQPVRDYIYIEDVVSALAKLLEHRCGYEIFNIGTGKGHSVGEVVGVIQKVWGVQKDVRTLHQPRENEISVSIANIEKITRELNWHPSYSLKSGLVDMHQKAK